MRMLMNAIIKEGVNLPELHNIQKNLLGSTGWAPGA